MREYKPNLAPLLEELTPHLLASDLEEIKKIVEKIDTEITESQQRFRG